MAGNGPPPNPNAKRRNARVGLTRLPAGGYKGTIPKWPLPVNPRLQAMVNMAADVIDELEEKELTEGKLSGTDRNKLARAKQRLAIAEAERDAIVETEKKLWRDLWRTPQAAAWAQHRWVREVAQYVRHKAAAECGSLEDSKEARLRADALGLTPKGLRSLMWTIDTDQVEEKRQERGPAAATGTDGAAARPKRRLAAVDPKGT